MAALPSKKAFTRALASGVAWAIDEINREFDSNSAATVQGYLDGTQQQPKRQSVEIAEVVEMLSDAGYESTMIRGIELTLSRVIHGVRVPFAELD